MTYSRTIATIRKKVVEGTVCLDELLIHVELALDESARESGVQADARRIADETELAIS